MIRLLLCLVGCVFALWACTDTIVCSMETCPTGCCNSSGACEGGENVGACGTSANACQRCAGGQRCVDHACTSGSGGGVGGEAGGGVGGGSNCGPSTCNNGCCTADGRCIRAPDNMLAVTCGVGGDVCRNCALIGQSCMTIGFCTDIDAGMDAGYDAGVPASTIDGHSTATVRSGTGSTTTTPLDLTSTTIEALVPLADGGYSQFVGGGSLAGTFAVQFVPQTKYFLRVGNQYFETAERLLNLDFERLGRIGVAPVADTALTLNATGLQPWSAATDQLRVYVPNLRIDAPRVERLFSSPPSANATTFNGTLNYTALRTPLVNSGLGDVVYVTQSRTTTGTGGVASTTIVAHAELPAFMMREAIASSVPAALGPTTQISQTVSWNLNAYALLKADLPPQGVGAGGDFTVVAYPSPITLNLSHTAGTIASVFVPEGVMTPASISFGSPFPTSYAIGARVGFDQTNARRVAGTTTGGEFLSGMFSDGPISYFTAPTMITPALSAVRQPTINGLNLFTVSAAVSETPTLSWSPPSVGTPSRYYVVVTRVYAIGMATVLDGSPSILWLDSTRLTLPPGIMAPGQSYVIQIGAISVPAGARLDRNVYAWGVPFHESVVASAVVTP